MPKFEAIPLSEAKLKSATDKRAQITQEYLVYIEELQAGQAGRLQPAEGETVRETYQVAGSYGLVSCSHGVAPTRDADNAPTPRNPNPIATSATAASL